MFNVRWSLFQLFGYKGEATLQVFIGNDSGKIRPHGFYQACKVCGKNSTACTEKDVDGTTVIEINLSPTDMTAAYVFHLCNIGARNILDSSVCISSL